MNNSIINKFLFFLPLLMLLACDAAGVKEKKVEVKEKYQSIKKDTVLVLQDTSAIIVEDVPESCLNDSLDELAKFIGGIEYKEQAKILKDYFELAEFKNYNKSFDAKWNQFDTDRLQKLKIFGTSEIEGLAGKPNTVFYPFSGPDILYASAFFPEAKKYILMGLEPIGTLPIYETSKEETDSIEHYFTKINTSLKAILQFSFFRTESMSKDLKNEELDGTLHLLLLFLARTGNTICDVKPVFIDTSGTIQYLPSFVKQKKGWKKNKGVEIEFLSEKKKIKTLYYFSTNLADAGLLHNSGIVKFIKNEGGFCTYLKGASYLMHKDYFSEIRNLIFEQSSSVVQDDSGIAIKYFEKDAKWNYFFYGNYIKPIPMFSQFYQKDLDSLYKIKGSKDLGFGIGYNFKDKNSNFMIAKRK